MKMKIKKLNENAIIPTRGSDGAAGYDLYACTLPNDKDKIDIFSGQTVMIKTGIAVAIPKGYVGLVFARSGLASKKGLAPANKVGVIDEDYRGEIMVALHNHSNQIPTIAVGERVAQLVVVPYMSLEFNEVDNLDDTERGIGGFGSTGG